MRPRPSFAIALLSARRQERRHGEPVCGAPVICPRTTWSRVVVSWYTCRGLVYVQVYLLRKEYADVLGADAEAQQTVVPKRHQKKRRGMAAAARAGAGGEGGEPSRSRTILGC